MGYEKIDDGYRFFFNDPSCLGHCYMNEAELENRWIDMDGDGNVYYYYGIEISGVTDYDPDGVYYME